jgi:hypothetical protein
LFPVCPALIIVVVLPSLLLLLRGRGSRRHCHPEKEDNPLQLVFDAREGELLPLLPRTRK